MLDAKAIEAIQKTAVEAAGRIIFKVETEPKHVYHTLDTSGVLTRVEAGPEPNDHYVSDFRSVVSLAIDARPMGSSLWCSADAVVAILSKDRRCKARLDLNHSKPFQKLCKWDESGGEHLDHVATYLIFRTLFRDCLPAHGTIRDDIKRVDIQKAQQAAGEVSRTAVSISKRLVAEASGADKLPDVLAFDVPVFKQFVAPVRAKIRVAFDLDPQQEKFRFVVLPGEIEAAEAQAEEWLERQVRETVASIDPGSQIPIYRGVP